jgi:hypothetical protein
VTRCWRGGIVFDGHSGRAGPIIVTISQSLGRDEAKRRVYNGRGYIREQLAAFVCSVDYDWRGYRLDFGLTAMRQSITGRIEMKIVWCVLNWDCLYCCACSPDRSSAAS